MVKYIAKRIGLAIVTIWAVATITFFLMNLVPGGPFLSEKAISPQATAALEAKYGLDKPLFHEVPSVCKSRRCICTGIPDPWSAAWLYCCPEEREVCRQSDQCGGNLWYCGSQLCYLYTSAVFLRS